MKKTARGYIVYSDPAHTRPQAWCVGCLATETQDDLKRHFLNWGKPGVEFLAAVIVPDEGN